MDPSATGAERRQMAGGVAALYLAVAYLVAMPFFLLFVKYPDVVDPTEKVAVIVREHAGMQVMYLITYVVFGLVLAVLALTLHAASRTERRPSPRRRPWPGSSGPSC